MGTVVVAVRAATAVLIKVVLTMVTAAFQDTRDTIMLSFIFCHIYIYIVTVGCSCKKKMQILQIIQIIKSF